MSRKYEQTNKKACSQWQVCGQKSLVAGRGHSRTTRFAQADRWPTKMQVTAQYHSDVQEGILNQATSQILKWMVHSSKTPCQVPLCQLKNECEEAMVGMSSPLHSGMRCLVRRAQGLCCNVVTAGWQLSINCMNPRVHPVWRLYRLLLVVFLGAAEHPSVTQRT